MLKKDIVIIGGGACGLLLSILLAQKGRSITLLEKNNSLAKKIRVSGNGKCNITNQNIKISNYHFGNQKLIKNLLSNFNYLHIKKLFSSLGVEFKEIEDGRVFPLSMNAQSVVNILYNYAKNLKVDIWLNCEVKEVTKDRNFKVKTIKNIFLAKKVIICTGSNAYKNIGVSDISYKIAKHFGHRVHSLYPSLVPVEVNNTKIHKANGVKIYSTIKTIVDKKIICKKSGDLLFTNYGLSGLVILDSSYHIAKAMYDKKEVYLKVDLLPFISLEELKNILLKREKLKNILDFNTWMEGVIDKKLISLIDCDNTINKKSINQISHNIKNLTIKIDAIRDAKYAEIIAGGIDTTQIKGNLESKKIQNLFFGGEALDICGDRGGYNLHFAFACAYQISLNL